MISDRQVNIHPTAIVHSGAELGEGVTIGPYCVISDHVKVGDDTVCKAHVNIEGATSIGSNCTIYPFTSLGTIPQDLKYDGEYAELKIGDYNVIREHVTMNIGTAGDSRLTRVGHHGLFMVGSHVAHDCIIGDHVVLANNATLAGHVIVGDYAIIGGLSGIHQFVRIGEHAMIGGISAVNNDVIPYGVVKGERAQLAGLNLVGLRRRGFEREHIFDLRQAYKLLFQEPGTFEQRVSNASSMFPESPLVINLLSFIKQGSERDVINTCCKEPAS